MTTVKLLPFPTSLSTPIVPPCNSTIFRVNCQAQSRAFVTARRAGFELFKLLENSLQVLRFDADTGVIDHQLEAVRVVRRSDDFHLAAIVGEFDRVGEQVVENLLELLLVERDVAELWCNVHR